MSKKSRNLNYFYLLEVTFEKKDNLYIFYELLIYSFVGWIYELSICSELNSKQFINRGFLLDPYWVCWAILQDIKRPIILFLSAAILCSEGDYLAGYAMENLFHVK
ncbi:putative ABC transporter permease [Anaerotignum sp.]|uniref:putative ABC transporter permease n=1 Tax=Anaerotignum sp. TaxID=2039241 RepID=UPI003FA4AB9F